MPAFLIPALRHRKLIGIGLLCLALAIQTVRLGHRTNQLEKERINSNELRGELQRISSKKNEQQVRTVENIKVVERIRDRAEGEAEKIEQAPTAPNCTTPTEIMGADL